MSPEEVSRWMLSELEQHGCVYQDDVVDVVVKGNGDTLLRENAEGNLVLGRPILDSFMKLSGNDVVWVKPDRYWRWRVAEDEPGREARG